MIDLNVFTPPRMGGWLSPGSDEMYYYANHRKQYRQNLKQLATLVYFSIKHLLLRANVYWEYKVLLSEVRLPAMIDNAVHHLHSKLTKCKSESDPDSSVAFPLIARSCNEEFTYDGHYCKKDQRKFAKRINSGRLASSY